MSFLSKIFAKNQPKQRIRVCIECGMPIAEHKQWCSILRGQQEMDRKAQAAAAKWRRLSAPPRQALRPLAARA